MQLYDKLIQEIKPASDKFLKLQSGHTHIDVDL